jgi:hypothetical protein
LSIIFQFDEISLALVISFFKVIQVKEYIVQETLQVIAFNVMSDEAQNSEFIEYLFIEIGFNSTDQIFDFKV